MTEHATDFDETEQNELKSSDFSIAKLDNIFSNDEFWNEFENTDTRVLLNNSTSFNNKINDLNSDVYTFDFDVNLSEKTLSPITDTRKETRIKHELDYFDTLNAKNSTHDNLNELHDTISFEQDQIKSSMSPIKNLQKDRGGLQPQSDDKFFMDEPVESLPENELRSSKIKLNSARRRSRKSFLPVVSSKIKSSSNITNFQKYRQQTQNRTINNPSQKIYGNRLKNHLSTIRAMERKPRRTHAHLRHISMASTCTRSIGWGVGSVKYAVSDAPSGRFTDDFRINQILDEQKIVISKLAEENKTLKIV
ncbi:hypothetical protein HK096_001376 [Nowakowskiella sp. JEL0078]|nr:hypothetical protein HK096_001376 [Nowakowskiella sp. JEL0078]